MVTDSMLPTAVACLSPDKNRAGCRPEAFDFFTCVYQGPSMNPLFKNGDRMRISRSRFQDIRPGDVIVFNDPEREKAIVHRVCHVDPQGIRTRGDNNRMRDPWLLRPEHIRGRVTHLVGKKRRRVFGGPLGRIIGFGFRIMKTADSWFSFSLRPFYHFLISLHLSRLWPSGWFETRLVSFSRPSGTEYQLCRGRRVIGRRLPDKNRWQIKRPFRLLVDEPDLAEKNYEEGNG